LVIPHQTLQDHHGLVLGLLNRVHCFRVRKPKNPERLCNRLPHNNIECACQESTQCGQLGKLSNFYSKTDLIVRVVNFQLNPKCRYSRRMRSGVGREGACHTPAGNAGKRATLGRRWAPFPTSRTSPGGLAATGRRVRRNLSGGWGDSLNDCFRAHIGLSKRRYVRL
jgi:hypothetical protein